MLVHAVIIICAVFRFTDRYRNKYSKLFTSIKKTRKGTFRASDIAHIIITFFDDRIACMVTKPAFPVPTASGCSNADICRLVCTTTIQMRTVL